MRLRRPSHPAARRLAESLRRSALAWERPTVLLEAPPRPGLAAAVLLLPDGWRVAPLYGRWPVAPGETKEIFNAQGPGVVTHIWFTISAVTCLLFTSRETTLFTVILLLGCLLMGVTVFVGMMERVHRKIRAVKREE